MRIRLLVTVACILGVAAVPARADTQGDVDVTVTITSGALSLTAPEESDLGAGVPGVPLTAQLGTVTVTDLRGQEAATWVATVTSTDFSTGGPGPVTIPTSAIEYWSGPASATEGAGTFVPGQPASTDAVPLSQEPVAFNRPDGDGGNAASWNPTLVVQVPAAGIAGAYTGTVTHSVA